MATEKTTTSPKPAAVGDVELRLAMLTELLSGLATKIDNARDVLLDLHESLPGAGFALIDSLTLAGWMADRGIELGGGKRAQVAGGIDEWALSPTMKDLVTKFSMQGGDHA